jgi:hypothetical protein
MMTEGINPADGFTDYDYLNSLPGKVAYFGAASPIRAGDLVEVYAGGMIRPAQYRSEIVIGVAATPGNDLYDRVGIYMFGPIYSSLVDGAMSAGQQITTGSGPGRIAVVRTGTPGAAIIGVCLMEADGAGRAYWMQIIKGG